MMSPEEIERKIWRVKTVDDLLTLSDQIPDKDIPSFNYLRKLVARRWVDLGEDLR